MGFLVGDARSQGLDFLGLRSLGLFLTDLDGVDSGDEGESALGSQSLRSELPHLLRLGLEHTRSLARRLALIQERVVALALH